MFFVLLFGFVGLLLRGFRGLVLGGVLGYLVSRIFRAMVLRGLRGIQSRYIESTFAVIGALCKADGVVTRDEIQFTEGLFTKFHLSPEQRALAKAAFARGKSADFDLDAEVDKFGRTVRHSSALIQFFLQIQILAIAADGQIHEKEHEMVVRIARRLGLGAVEIAHLEAMLRAAARGPSEPSGPPPQERHEDAYAALGVSPTASDEEVKRAYKKLIIEHHPDKLAAKGLPENMREFAEERAREINAAFDLIKKSRGL
jgi:DnaJ like chaperone protein